jgi:hypothetical protein
LAASGKISSMPSGKSQESFCCMFCMSTQTKRPASGAFFIFQNTDWATLT